MSLDSTISFPKTL